MKTSTPLIRPWPERFIRWLPLPYWLTWLLIWELVFLIDYMVGLSVSPSQQHVTEFGCLTVFFAFVCITIIYCSKVLLRLYDDLRLFIDHDEQQLRAWYQKRLSLSYDQIWPLIFGIFFSLVVNLTVGEEMNQFTPDGTWIYYLRIAYEFIGFFFLGAGIWALINVIYIPISLTQYKIKVSVNQVSGRGLQALGAAYFRMSLAITVTFIPLVIAAIISPLIEDLSILIWLGGGTLAIFGFFLLPQIGIHRIMAHEKQQRLLSFATYLEDAMEQTLREPTTENMQRLKDYFELQAHLKNMNEWPFNVSTLWQLITALFIPVVLAILEIFF
jgi:hypothetical protein